MEAKPLSLQSPQTIATEYGGNKQKIAQAVQMGLVDPTSGVLAGMFIDRMRNAQAQEQAPQQTVAQQVMQAKPPQVPQGAPGLPGIPTSVAPVAQAPQRAMQQPISQAPVNAADGGLMSIPVPDAMFDEPGEDAASYAPGGIVAFDDGGQINLPQIQAQFDAQAKDPSITRAQAQGIRNQSANIDNLIAAQNAANTINSGFKSVYDYFLSPQGEQPTTTYAPTSTPGIAKAPQGATTPAAAAAAASAGPPGATTPPVPPPAPTPAAASAGPPGATTPPVLSPADAAGLAAIRNPLLAPPSGAGNSQINSIVSRLEQKVTPPDIGPNPYADQSSDPAKEAEILKSLAGTSDKNEKAYNDYLNTISSPEYQAKEKTQDLWSTLAQIGFGMAGSSSPYALQALGQSASAAMPDMQKRIEARKKEVSDAAKGLADIEHASNQDKIAIANTAMDAAQKTAQGSLTFASQKAALAMQAQQLQQQGATSVLSALTQLASTNAEIQAQYNNNDFRQAVAAEVPNLLASGQAKNIAEATAMAADKYLNRGMFNTTTGANEKATSAIDTFLDSSAGRGEMMNIRKLQQQDAKTGGHAALEYRKNLILQQAANNVSTPGQTPGVGFGAIRYDANGNRIQ